MPSSSYPIKAIYNADETAVTGLGEFGSGDTIALEALPVGTGPAQVAYGNHNHDTVYSKKPASATIDERVALFADTIGGIKQADVAFSALVRGPGYATNQPTNALAVFTGEGNTIKKTELSGPGLLKVDASGVASVAASGKDYQGVIASTTGLLKGTGVAGGVTAATAGTDYATLTTAAPAALAASAAVGVATTAAKADHVHPLPTNIANAVSCSTTSVANQLAAFSDMTGKAVTPMTSSLGVLKLTSGVLGAATAGSDYVSPSVATDFSKPQRPSVASLTNTGTWDLSTYQILYLTLSGTSSIILYASALDATMVGRSYRLVIGGSTTASLTLPVSIRWNGTLGVPALTNNPGVIDIFTFEVITIGSSQYLCEVGRNLNVG